MAIFNPDPYNVTGGIFNKTSNSIPSIDSMFNNLSGLSYNDLQKFQIEQQLQLNTSNLIQQFEEQQRQAREARLAYEATLQDKKESAAKARAILAEQNASQLKLANYRKEISDINASTLINNAYAVARAGVSNFNKGISQTFQVRAQAQNAFAKGGVDVNKGSAVTVVDSIAREGFRQSNEVFKDSLNKVNGFLTQAFTLRFNAEMDVLATEEQNRLNTKLTEISLGNESGVPAGTTTGEKPIRLSIRTSGYSR